MADEKKTNGLPENATRELKEGEKYSPVLPSDSNVPEVSFYSVTCGIVMAILFSAGTDP